MTCFVIPISLKKKSKAQDVVLPKKLSSSAFPHQSESNATQSNPIPSHPIQSSSIQKVETDPFIFFAHTGRVLQGLHGTASNPGKVSYEYIMQIIRLQPGTRAAPYRSGLHLPRLADLDQLWEQIMQIIQMIYARCTAQHVTQ